MENEQSDKDIDYVMKNSYDSLIIDIDKTIEEFIVFTIDDEVIEIEQGKGERSKFIDGMINYFETIEEFEKCQNLINLKVAVIKNGD